MTKVVIKNGDNTTLIEVNKFNLGQQKLEMWTDEGRILHYNINEVCKTYPQRSDVEKALIQGFRNGFLEIQVFDKSYIGYIG